MTEKLYWRQPHTARFTARVEASRLENGQRILTLDQTAFYPTGGGQPCDLGRIETINVVNVEITDDGRIHHKLATDADFAIGAEIAGEIDWPRRLEMLQQHTGQHILSQAFFQLFGAETRGFRITERLNDRVTEIDLTLEMHPDELRQAIQRAEDLANSIVFDNREIRIHEVTPDEAARLPLRKESFITDCIRVVEIADYDWSPCGGTHAGRTGEVGLIAVRAWERAKKMTRVHFVCGIRALRDYRLANQVSDAIAQKFSGSREDAESSVDRLIEENKRLARRVRELTELAAKAEAAELLAATETTNGLRIVARVFTDRDFEEAKLLAHRLTDGENAVALLGLREKEMARIVFARSANVSADMNALIKTACERLGGRGGGKPDFAQGGGARVEQLKAALEAAKTTL